MKTGSMISQKNYKRDLLYEKPTNSVYSGVLMLCLPIGNKSSAVAELGDRLATIDTGRKVGGCCAPFLRGIREGRKPKQLQAQDLTWNGPSWPP